MNFNTEDVQVGKDSINNKNSDIFEININLKVNN